MMTKRLVYICDWLPPDFGAVGQYAVLFARQWASEGMGGDAGRIDQRAIEPTGRRTSGRWLARGASHPSPHLQETEIRGAAGLDGCLERPLAQRSFRAMRRADAVLFTGSPPLMVHFIAPLNLLASGSSSSIASRIFIRSASSPSEEAAGPILRSAAASYAVLATSR